MSTSFDTYQRTIPVRETSFPKYNPNRCQEFFTNPRKVFCFIVAPIILFCIFGVPIIAYSSQAHNDNTNNHNKHHSLTFNPDWDNGNKFLCIDQSVNDDNSISHDTINSNLVFANGLMTRTSFGNNSLNNKEDEIEKKIKQDMPPFMQNVINNLTHWTSKNINANIPANLQMHFQSWIPDNDDNDKYNHHDDDHDDHNDRYNGYMNESSNLNEYDEYRYDCNEAIMKYLGHKYNELFEYLYSLLNSKNKDECVKNMEHGIPKFALSSIDNNDQTTIEDAILNQIASDSEETKKSKNKDTKNENRNNQNNDEWEWSLFGAFGGGFQIYCNDQVIIDAGGGSGAYYQPRSKSHGKATKSSESRSNSNANTNTNTNTNTDWDVPLNTYEKKYEQEYEPEKASEYQNEYQDEYRQEYEEDINYESEYDDGYDADEYNGGAGAGGGGGGVQLYLNESLRHDGDKKMKQSFVVSVGGGTGSENDKNTVEMDWDSDASQFYHYLPKAIDRLKKCYDNSNGSKSGKDTNNVNVRIEGGGGGSGTVMYYRVGNENGYSNVNNHYCKAQFSYYLYSGQ